LLEFLLYLVQIPVLVSARFLELLLNVILPVAGGTAIYLMPVTNSLFRNHLPDGLWAYALTYFLMLIWNKQVPSVWLLCLTTLFLLFEGAQYMGWIEGTGDLRDLIVYFLFSGAALLSGSHLFTKKNQYEKNE